MARIIAGPAQLPLQSQFGEKPNCNSRKNRPEEREFRHGSINITLRPISKQASEEVNMINRRILAASLTSFLICPPGLALAEGTPFTEEAFRTAQRDGRRILIDVWASWCPVCRAQGPLLKSTLESPENRDILMFRVDFDTQADVLATLNVRSQSTLIMFKGDKETSRSIGDTSADGIAALVSSSE